MAYKASDVIAIALAEVGYLEKKSNSQLDDPTANVGYNNYTKYARDLAEAGYYQGSKQSYAWCDVWVDWCFWMMCGKDKKKAEAIQFQEGLYGAGCPWSARYYRNKGRFYTSGPKPGDQIFFGTIGSESHTGIVEKVEGAYVYTIEGNTTSVEGVVPNGGGVFRKKYVNGSKSIAGYGRPDFDAVDGTPVAPTPPSETKKDDTTTKEMCEVKLTQLRKGNKGTAVKSMQLLLIGHGYSVGPDGADGDFGKNTDSALRKFQAAKKIGVDGICGTNSWTKLVEG